MSNENTNTMTLAEFVEKEFGTTVVKRKFLGEKLFDLTTLTNWPAGLLSSYQRTDKMGYYETKWNSDNPDPEPIVQLKDSSTTSATPSAPSENTTTEDTKVASQTPSVSLVPKKMPGFVSTPNYQTLRNIIKSRIFFPTYISGDTGCGKTLMVRQACAMNKRDLVRLNFTEQTGEAHIIGSFKLVDGETVWVDGPAITAMRRGAVLLLDEVDLGSPKMMCLQPILEGSPYFIERTGEMVYPADGFTIVATANTKGKMTSSSRKFVGARNQNEAFLDRFSMTLEQEYPNETQERKILEAVKNESALLVGTQATEEDDRIFDVVYSWVRAIREAYLSGSYDAHLSTRRAKDVIRGYFILNRSIKKAVMGSVARFDETTSEAFLKMFNTMNDTDLDWSAEQPDDDFGVGPN